MVVLRELNRGRVEKGQMAGKWLINNVRQRWRGEIDLDMDHTATSSLMAKRERRSLFNTTELYSHTQFSTFSPELHQGPKPLVQIANWLGKKQPAALKATSFWQWNLIMHWCAVVFVPKIELPIMGDKTSFCRSSHSYKWIAMHFTILACTKFSQKNKKQQPQQKCKSCLIQCIAKFSYPKVTKIILWDGGCTYVYSPWNKSV